MLDPLTIMILSSSRIEANMLLKALNLTFGGKGGGNPKIAQGKFEREPKEVLERVKEFIKEKKGS